VTNSAVQVPSLRDVLLSMERNLLSFDNTFLYVDFLTTVVAYLIYCFWPLLFTKCPGLTWGLPSVSGLIKSRGVNLMPIL
jgi:hypothetical protein